MSTLSGKVLLRVYDNIHTLDGRQTEMIVLPCTIDKIKSHCTGVFYFRCSMKKVASQFNTTPVL